MGSQCSMCKNNFSLQHPALAGAGLPHLPDVVFSVSALSMHVLDCVHLLLLQAVRTNVPFKDASSFFVSTYVLVPEWAADATRAAVGALANGEATPTLAQALAAGTSGNIQSQFLVKFGLGQSVKLVGLKAEVVRVTDV